MASDTSLIFTLLGRDVSVSSALTAIKNGFRSTAETAEEAMRKASNSTERLDRQIDETKRHLAELNREFARTGDKSLFKKIADDRALLSNLTKIRKELKASNDEAGKSSGGNGFSGLLEQFSNAPGIIGKLGSGLSSLIGLFESTAEPAERTAGSVASMGSSLAASTGPIGAAVVAALALVGVIDGLVAAFLSLGPAVSLAGGALGSLPGLLAGGIAGIGALKLGLTGLSSEYTRLTSASGGGGGGAAKAAKDFTAANRAVQSAVEELARSERDVTTAQQEALASQQAVTAARETASKRIRDESLSLQGAQLDQKDAAQAVVDAQNALNIAQATGNTGEIDKAQEAYDRAVIAAQEAKNKVDDLTEANRKNAKSGVEGSDEVIQAKKQEATARQRVADSIQAEHDAELRLADARKSLADQKAAPAGGGGGAGQQITQLAPAARSFLNAIIGLRPAFKDLRLDVQQHLFAGLAGPIKTLAEKWLPQLHKTLGNFADTFNGIAKTAFATAGKKTFIHDMAAGADGVRKALGEIGKVAAGPLLDAFGRLARASTPFVQKLGHLIAGTVTHFSDWIRKADESHKLTAFFKGAADTLGKVWSIGGKVVKIVGEFVEILFPQSQSSASGVLDGVNTALTKISTWLDNPKHQQAIRNLIGGVISLVKTFWSVADGAAHGFMSVIHGLENAYHGVVNFGGKVIDWFKRLQKAAAADLMRVWDPLRDGFKGAINWIIDKWNSISFNLPSVTLPFIGKVGGQPISLGHIPYLAGGGDVTGGGMVVVGERGPEPVFLPRGASVAPNSSLKNAMGGTPTVIFDFRGVDGEFARLLMKTVRTKPGVAVTLKQALA